MTEAGPDGPGSPRRATAIALAAGALVVVGAAAWTLHGMQADGHALVGDEARTAVEALDALQTRPRLGVLTTAGEYVDRDINNPGPLHLWTLFPFVRLLGTDLGAWTWALTIGLASIATAGWAAARQRGRAVGLLAVIVVTAMAASTNPGGLTHSLNTEVVLLPAFCCIVLAWGVTAGDSLLLPVLVGASTFVVQTFVGDAPLVLPACLVAVAGLARATRGTEPQRSRRRHVAIAAGIGLVLWLPALEDQVSGTGNLGALLGFRAPGQGLEGARRALAASLDLTSLRGGVQGPTVLDASGAAVAGSLLVIVAFALIPATRRAAIRTGPLVAVAAATVAGAAAVTFATPRTDTATYHYFAAPMARFVVLLTLLVVLAEAVRGPVLRWAADEAGRPSPRTAALRAGKFAVLGAGAVLVVVPVLADDTAGTGRTNEMRAVTHLSDELGGQLDPDRPYHVISRGGSDKGNVAQGVIAQLRSQGFRVASAFQSQSPDETVLVITDDLRTADDGGEVLSTATPSTPVAHSLDLEALRDRARDAGPVVLTPSGAGNLADRIDGVEPALCLASIEGDPDALLDLPPAVVAQLYDGGDLDTRALTPEDRRQLSRWSANAAFDVIALPDDGAWRDRFGYDELFLSRPDCPR